MKMTTFVVQELPEDPRLDKVIPLHVKTLSRSAARKLIEEGGVYLNTKRCRKNGKLVAKGDKIRLAESQSEKPSEFLLTPEHILFENEDWIVVNKPPFLPTHETIDNARHHLARAVQNFLAAREKKTEVYLGIHHRLDRDTSGVILFSKCQSANPALAKAFQERQVEKTYLAISAGKLAKPLVVKSFLAPGKNKRFYCSVRSGGKYAETELRSLASHNAHGQTISLIEAKPKTGRTHQIRVHLAENQLPILGDKAYGRAFPGAERVLLHAWKLDLLGKSFRAPFPEDFRRLDFQEPND